ncbi:NAD(P)-binding protein [Artomyces pyxidatus]|uniref:NAD(P)-binding protein n=1 Tax=Artomyces pyxidatus TaxID=48021 RepID=A0ACB8SK80_9AGAM|nr:NAD(P)-binding protein [Artomyces pyxidatus]
MSTIFFLGATGYIGGAILVALRERYPTVVITALVRNPAHLDKISATGAQVLQGLFEDLDLITEQSSLADIVLNAADSDTISLAQAILKGAKRRADEGKSKTVLIHTSGVAVFSDGRRDGKYDPNGRLWNDNSEQDIKDITSAKLHGQVDVPILEAGVEGYIEGYIICPAAVVGAPRGPLGGCSTSFKFIAKLLQSMGRIVYPGEGSNQFTFVDLDDTVDLFIRVFERARKGAPPGESPYARYYIATSTAVDWKTMAVVIGGALARHGKLTDSTAYSIPTSEFGPALEPLLGGSLRIQADRSKALGWTPRPVDIADYIEGDIDALLSALQ